MPATVSWLPLWCGSAKDPLRSYLTFTEPLLCAKQCWSHLHVYYLVFTLTAWGTPILQMEKPRHRGDLSPAVQCQNPALNQTTGSEQTTC